MIDPVNVAVFYAIGFGNGWQGDLCRKRREVVPPRRSIPSKRPSLATKEWLVGARMELDRRPKDRSLYNLYADETSREPSILLWKRLGDVGLSQNFRLKRYTNALGLQ